MRALASRERKVSEVVQDIERARSDLGAYLAEIDRRRHEALDWRLQLWRHRTAVTLVGAGLAAGLGMAIGAFVRRRG
ncbi:MAG TPA: hypothetical protein VLJ18_02390 [Thermoanaerobaculia bacterium]|nr:hypothetical protein [Thermoanaerobaculia bacterium]